MQIIYNNKVWEVKQSSISGNTIELHVVDLNTNEEDVIVYDCKKVKIIS